MEVAMWISRVLILTLVGIAPNDAAKWTYSGNAGPSYWHEVFPEACSGKHQSPIDIRSEETVYDSKLKEFAIYYDPPKPDSKMFISNNGHTIQVNLKGDFYVTNGGLNNVYKALQFHFHWGHKLQHGSEHLIDGLASPIEMHLVTYNQELFTDVGEALVTQGGLAVLGTMYEISEDDNPSLTTIIKAIKHIRDPDTRDQVELPLMSLREFLPKDISRYYRYNGSLTTPGCFESVIWTVFDEKQTISLAQLKEFTTVLQHKHYHRKDHKGAGSRHRRSLNKAEKQMEHRAEHVLDELGIRGNGFEEAVLMTEVMQMMADMPEDDEVKEVKAGSEEHNKEEEKDDPENDVTKEKKEEDKEKKEEDKNEDDHKEIEDVKDHEDHDTDEDEHVKDKKKHTEDHAAEDHATDKKITKEENHEEEKEEEYTQDIMVNNFRPVQPLNGRVVYRSFNLNDGGDDDDDDDDDDVGDGDDDEVIAFKAAQSSDNNIATHHVMSLPAILSMSILTLIQHVLFI